MRNWLFRYAIFLAAKISVNRSVLLNFIADSKSFKKCEQRIWAQKINSSLQVQLDAKP